MSHQTFSRQSERSNGLRMEFHRDWTAGVVHICICHLRLETKRCCHRERRAAATPCKNTAVLFVARLGRQSVILPAAGHSLPHKRHPDSLSGAASRYSEQTQYTPADKLNVFASSDRLLHLGRTTDQGVGHGESSSTQQVIISRPSERLCS